jgi:small subunit ribosomal protein S4
MHRNNFDRRMSENIGAVRKARSAATYGPASMASAANGFGRHQLRAKQTPGLLQSPKSSSCTYQEAARWGDTGQNLIGLLEQRLDMVIYRCKFARRFSRPPDRRTATSRQRRQMQHRQPPGVPGDIISLGNKARTWPGRRAQAWRREIPDYVAPTAPTGDLRARADAGRSAIRYRLEPNLVVEFYSR